MQYNVAPSLIPARPSNSQVLELAGRASVDPRTVRRWLAGESIRPMGRDRLEKAARELGVGVPR